jgi:RNA polymerase sigma-70 factor (ECF subfamily)
MAVQGATSDAIEAVYRARFRAFLLSVTALLRDGEAALDVVQEGFAVALDRRRSFRGEGGLEAWLWRIVLNLAYDRQRSNKRASSASEWPASDGESSGTDDRLQAALLALPERQRLAIFLRYYADLSYAQIAEALAIRPGTVAASLHAAREALRRELRQEVSR